MGRDQTRSVGSLGCCWKYSHIKYYNSIHLWYIDQKSIRHFNIKSTPKLDSCYISSPCRDYSSNPHPGKIRRAGEPIIPFSPSLPLEVGPLNAARGLGSAVSSPAGSGAEPQPKSNLVHFSLKIWHLVGTISIIFMRINWPNFSRCQISARDLNFRGGISPGYMPRIITYKIAWKLLARSC